MALALGFRGLRLTPHSPLRSMLSAHELQRYRGGGLTTAFISRIFQVRHAAGRRHVALTLGSASYQQAALSL